MPYKNKEDKHANARFHYNKHKKEKRCSIEGCEEILPTSRKKFCSDACSNKYFTDKIRIEKQLKREKEAVVKYCAYVECGKQLPKTAHAQKRYCPGTNCATKQNALEAKQKRDAKRAASKVVILTCENDTCDETFEKKQNKRYCCNECKKQQNNRDFTAKKKQEEEMIKLGKIKRIRYSNKPPKKEKFVIKHFSAQWLEDLWNKRETA